MKLTLKAPLQGRRTLQAFLRVVKVSTMLCYTTVIYCKNTLIANKTSTTVSRKDNDNLLRNLNKLIDLFVS